ncbi:N-formimino-L-glutamate deiminase [compost metagenome]
MRRQQRRADLDRIVLRKLLRHAQHFRFGLVIQTVTGFDLKRGDALLHQALQPLLRQRQQRFRRACARRRDRGVNSAALRTDRLIRNAIKTQLPLAGAVAAKHQMGMTVNQARRDQPPFKVNLIRMIYRDVSFRNQRQDFLAAYN